MWCFKVRALAADVTAISPTLSPLGQWTPVTTSPIEASRSKVYYKENFRFSQFHCYVQIYFYDRWTPVFSGKKIQWGQWKAQPQMCKLTDQGCIKKSHLLKPTPWTFLREVHQPSVVCSPASRHSCESASGGRNTAQPQQWSTAHASQCTLHNNSHLTLHYHSV